MRLIGIHDHHNASVAYMENGEVLFVLQEERLTREKNAMGAPLNALNEVFRRYNITAEDIDMFLFVGHGSAKTDVPATEYYLKKYNAFFERRESFWQSVLKRIRRLLAQVSFLKRFYDLLTQSKQKQPLEERVSFLLQMGVPREKIDFVEHHLCHAATAAYGSSMEGEYAVVTADSMGDGISGTVNLYKNGEINRKATIAMEDSVARLYSLITYYLGMVPMEHEYKLLGLSSYSQEDKRSREVADYFHTLFKQSDDGLTFRRRPGLEPVFEMGPRLKDALKYRRFDYVAGGLEIFTEEFIAEWIKNVLTTLKVRRVVFAGGLFMNVKLNKVISELEEVDEMFVFPSCGDESNVFGALYHYYYTKTNEFPKPLDSLYLGGDYSDKEIKNAVDGYSFKNKIEVSYEDDIEKEVAKYIASGNVVARAKGRVEFGARALGNRSIIADPSKPGVVKLINKMIKNRDFWMPFSPSIVDVNDYMQNPKDIKSPYMMHLFDALPEKTDYLGGSLHAYDCTGRPQEVLKEHNPDYYNLIVEYKNLTGESAILNTSFNLHGFPIVYHPKDALYVFDNSGLEYLALGNYLIKKNV